MECESIARTSLSLSHPPSLLGSFLANMTRQFQTIAFKVAESSLKINLGCSPPERPPGLPSLCIFLNDQETGWLRTMWHTDRLSICHGDLSIQITVWDDSGDDWTECFRADLAPFATVLSCGPRVALHIIRPLIRPRLSTGEWVCPVLEEIKLDIVGYWGLKHSYDEKPRGKSAPANRKERQALAEELWRLIGKRNSEEARAAGVVSLRYTTTAVSPSLIVNPSLTPLLSHLKLYILKTILM